MKTKRVFTYLTAQVIDGNWHVWDMDGNSSDYHQRGKVGIDRLIHRYGTDSAGNSKKFCFKLFRGKNDVRLTDDVCSINFPSVPDDVKKSKF